MHTNHLAYFVEVAKKGSISRAAKELFISQPSLSASIAKLEEELGVKLFYRSQNGAHLTEQGQQILEYAQEALKSVENIKSVVTQEVNLTGEVKISAIPAACNDFIINLIELAHERYSRMAIIVNEERPNIVIQQVLQGQVNLGISSYRMDQEKGYQLLFKEKRLDFLPLFTDSLCAYVSTSHPLAQQSDVTLEQLNSYSQVCFRKDIYMHDLTNDMGILGSQSYLGLEKMVYQFSNLNSIMEIVAKDLAVAILPIKLRYSGSLKDRLIQLPIKGADLRFIVGVVQKNIGVPSILERKIIEMLKEISQ